MRPAADSPTLSLALGILGKPTEKRSLSGGFVCYVDSRCLDVGSLHPNKDICSIWLEIEPDCQHVSKTFNVQFVHLFEMGSCYTAEDNLKQYS